MGMDIRRMGALRDPDRNILSYLTPLGQALLKHKVGEEVALELEGDNRSYRIESIAAHQPTSTEAEPGQETEEELETPAPVTEAEPEPVAAAEPENSFRLDWACSA